MALETFGSIIKEEQVKTIEHHVLPNTLVLENLGYFPGYYGADLPVHREIDSIFLVMTQKEATEKILRLSHNIRKKLKLSFEGTSSSLSIHNQNYDAIRLRYLKEYSHIAEIQQQYRHAGIVFEKSKKIDDTAIIQIKKIFKVDKATDKILKDDERGMYYLKIDEQLTWEQFRTVTFQLRNNVKLSAFDAALAVIYGAEVLDLVRIYTTQLTIAELELLHDKYEELITKLL